MEPSEHSELAGILMRPTRPVATLKARSTSTTASTVNHAAVSRQDDTEAVRNHAYKPIRTVSTVRYHNDTDMDPFDAVAPEPESQGQTRVSRGIRSVGVIHGAYDLSRSIFSNGKPRETELKWTDIRRGATRPETLQSCQLMTFIEFDSVENLSQKIHRIYELMPLGWDDGKLWACAVDLACSLGNGRALKFLLDFFLPKNVDASGKRHSSKLDKRRRHLFHVLGDEGLALGHGDLRVAFAPHVIEILKSHICHTNVLVEVDEQQRTPIHCACQLQRRQRSKVGLCTSLIDWTKPCDVHRLNQTDKTPRGLNPLHYACELGLLPVVQHLVEAGVDINLTTEDSCTPLHRACGSSHTTTELVRYLCDNGSDLDARESDGSTALHQAARQRDPNALHGLLPSISSHIAMHPKDNLESTPLMLASATGRPQNSMLFSPRQRSRSWRPVPDICKTYPAMVSQWTAATGYRSDRKTVQYLLYERDAIANKRYDFPSEVVSGPRKTWLHLAANNIEWCDELLTSWHLAAGRIMGGVECLKAARKAFDLQHNAQSGSRRARFLEPGVQIHYPNIENEHQIVFIAAPYIHFETSANMERMKQILGPSFEAFSSRSPFGSADARLYAAYAGDRGFHPRRTLDEYLYHNMDTNDRDIDQVVQRYQRECMKSDYSVKHGKNTITNRFAIMPEHSEDVITMMVDQLWIWLIGDDLMITSAPSRWGRPAGHDQEKERSCDSHEDPFGAFEGTRHSVLSTSTHSHRPSMPTLGGDLAMHAMVHCFGIFDRHARAEPSLQFMSMFEQSIGAIGAREGTLLKNFTMAYQALVSDRRASARSASEELEVVEKLNDLAAETELLSELKDIRDELNIIKTIFQDQQRISNTLADIQRKTIMEGSRPLFQPVKGNISTGTGESCKEVLEPLDAVINDGLQTVARLDKQAARVAESISELLQLKQAHSNAFLSLDAARLSRSAAKQARAVMVFTVVTIFFLPMSFVASFFSMRLVPLAETRRPAGIEVWLVASCVFPIGIGLAIPFIFLAFYASGDVKKWWEMAKEKTRRLGRTTKNDAAQQHAASKMVHASIEHGKDAPTNGMNAKSRKSRTTSNGQPSEESNIGTKPGSEPSTSSGAERSIATTREDSGGDDQWVMRRLIRQRKAVTSAV